jgi:hypothetical protein
VSSVFLRALTAYLAAFALIWLLFFILYLLIGSAIGDDGFPFVAGLLLFVLLPFFLVGGIINIIVLESLILTLGGGFYKLSEVFVRKVAEYDKGPVLGASALLGGIRLLLKNF